LISLSGEDRALKVRDIYADVNARYPVNNQGNTLNGGVTYNSNTNTVSVTTGQGRYELTSHMLGSSISHYTISKFVEGSRTETYRIESNFNDAEEGADTLLNEMYRDGNFENFEPPTY
jgi:hypothetical protein